MQYFYILVVISQELTQNTVVLSHLIRKYKNNGQNCMWVILGTMGTFLRVQVSISSSVKCED